MFYTERIVGYEKTVSVCSVLCGIVALATLVLGIRAIFTNNSFYVGLSLFHFAAQSKFMGFIGNVLGIAVTCLGFGALAYCGFSGTQSSKKNGFIYGLIMTGVCVSIAGKSFTMGDLFITLLPAVYTFATLKSA